MLKICVLSVGFLIYANEPCYTFILVLSMDVIFSHTC
jgi:hypothetical protein